MAYRLPRYGGTIRIAAATTIANLDPVLSVSEAQFVVSQNVFTDLVKINPDLSIAPDLATSWRISSDKTEYLFKLRNDVRFHDGTKFDAAAVKFNIERILDPSLRSPAAQYYEGIDRIDAADPEALRITFSRPNSIFISKILSIPTPRISSPSAVETFGKDYGVKALVGTGPFKLSSFDQDSSEVLLERNHDYYVPGRPYLDSVRIHAIVDHHARANALVQDETDYAQDLPLEMIERLREGGMSVWATPYGAVERIALNCKKPPMDDRRVRQALSMAISRERINAIAYRGTAREASNVIPPAVSEYHSGVGMPSFSYNPSKARELLQQYLADTGKESRDLDITLIASPGVGDGVLFAEMIAHDLEAMGWRLTVKIEDSVSLFRRLAAPFGEHDTEHGFFSRNAPGGDVDRFFGVEFLSGRTRNYFDYSNPEMDELINQFRSADSLAERLTILRKVERLLDRDVPSVYLVWPPLIMAMRGSVHGFVPMGLDGVEFAENLWIDGEPR